jgi:hypothetical protein
MWESFQYFEKSTILKLCISEMFCTSSHKKSAYHKKKDKISKIRASSCKITFLRNE